MRTFHPAERTIEKDGYKVIKCRRCGYWHVHPMPQQNELDAYYRKKYNARTCSDASMTDKISDPDGFYELQYRDRLRYISGFMDPGMPKSVLDIGAGFGDFLSFMKKNGWRTQGTEPSQDTAGQIRHRGVNIRVGSIESLYNELEPASVVAFHNVLEHLSDPAAALKLVRENLIAVGGLISIIVPNDFNPLQESLSLTVLKNDKKNRYYWLAPPEHLNYWSTLTVREFLEKCGFSVLGVTGDFPMELFALMGDDYISDPGIGRKVHLKRVRFEKNIAGAGMLSFKDRLFGSMADAGAGRAIHVIARPGKRRGGRK